jgi:tRNA uridine 5-carbamoylmethylation protein Kti12
MAELIVTRGLPGSGKSTWAKAWVAEDRKNRIRINRDDLRTMVDDGEFVDKLTEPRIVMARDALILQALRKGLSVVVDDTNLPNSVIKQLRKLAEKRGAAFRIQDFRDVPLDVCLERNAQREGRARVPEEIIQKFYKDFVKDRSDTEFELDMHALKLETYENGTKYRKHAMIVDIDGTVAKMQGRSPYDYSKVTTDVPNWPVIFLVKTLMNKGVKPLFTSGRPDSCRSATVDWLRRFVLDSFTDFELFMRTTEDKRPDWIVKYELFDKHIRNDYNVLMVLDDRDQVVEMWRKIGLTCFQVAEGDF